MFKKAILIFVLVFVIAILGFFIMTYSGAWAMLPGAAGCGESPIGFYRFEIVPYEWSDEGGGVQTGAPIGGVWEFVKFYLGKYELCK